jgi:hypothetical protein
MKRIATKIIIAIGIITVACIYLKPAYMTEAFANEQSNRERWMSGKKTN